MKQFVIAWLSFHDNELYMKEVEAKSLYDAVCSAYEQVAEIPYEGIPTIDDVKTAAFNIDGSVDAIEIGKI